MKIHMICKMLAVLLGFSMMSAYADRSTGETIDDSTLATSVKMSLIEDAEAPGGSINVETYKGTVQLIGFVHSDGEKKAALERAREVDGVSKVVDAILVVPEKRSVGVTIDDQTIQGKVKLAIGEVGGADKALAIVTEVRNGEVLLGGFVSSEKVRDEIETSVKTVKGVSKVHNKIGIKG